MILKKLSLILLTLNVVVALQAEPEDRTALVNELTRLSGIGEMVNEAKKASAHQADTVIEQMFAQMKSAMPIMSKETIAEIKAAADKMMGKVQASWSADEAIQVWQNEFTRDFSENELRIVIAGMKTPLGQKQILAGKLASAGLQKFLLDRIQTTMDAAIKEYVTELQHIATQAADVPVEPESP